jgi:DNA-binding LytR/AlgR family response regulator
METFTKKNNSENLILNYGKKTVSFENIKYIESYAGNYSMIRLSDKGYICSAFTLKHYTSRLESTSSFYLARKGLLINTNFIEEISDLDGVKWMKLSTGEIFKLSRRQGAKLINHIGLN